ncbi:hypothetical protein BLOT_016367 [Blomia tropicalis]|nr:hypothetical protein BLOT_016367 [Blomia tropicalis]
MEKMKKQQYLSRCLRKAFETHLGYSPFSYPLPHSPYHNGSLMLNDMRSSCQLAKWGICEHKLCRKRRH